jgi:hypothetical protein
LIYSLQGAEKSTFILHMQFIPFTGTQKTFVFLTTLFSFCFSLIAQASTKPAICLNPSASITRAEIAQALGVTVSEDQVQSVELKDVTDTHPAYLQIQQAIAFGWMSPDKNGRFFPNRLLTRDEGFAILAQALGVSKANQTAEVKQFSDFRQAANWTKPNLSIALTQGIVNVDRGIRPRDWMLADDLCYGLVQVERVKKSQVETSTKVLWGIFGAIGLGTIGLFLLCRKPFESSAVQFRIAPLATPKAVKCLQVTELQISALEQMKVRSQNVKVLLFPASFGDQTCTYVVKSVPDVEGEIFTIAISPQGSLVLTPHPKRSLRCNGLPVPSEGITLEKQVRSRIEYQQTQWLIQPSSEVPQRKTSAAYFEQLERP